MNKEIKYLLEEIKNNTYDYVGTNGCLYQDLSREELNLLLEYISNLQNQVQKQKEVIDKVSSQIKLYGKYNGEKCTRGFSVMTADFNKLLDILKEVSK